MNLASDRTSLRVATLIGASATVAATSLPALPGSPGEIPLSGPLVTWRSVWDAKEVARYCFSGWGCGDLAQLDADAFELVHLGTGVRLRQARQPFDAFAMQPVSLRAGYDVPEPQQLVWIGHATRLMRSFLSGDKPTPVTAAQALSNAARNAEAEAACASL